MEQGHGQRLRDPGKGKQALHASFPSVQGSMRSHFFLDGIGVLVFAGITCVVAPVARAYVTDKDDSSSRCMHQSRGNDTRGPTDRRPAGVGVHRQPPESKSKEFWNARARALSIRQ